MIPMIQPRDSNLCGQTCVAMVTGNTVEKICRMIGHSHSTRTSELARVLEGFGFFCEDRLRRIRKGGRIPSNCLLKVTFKMRGGDGKRLIRKGHWMLRWDGRTYDPDPRPVSFGEVTSYLKIF
jgi:hypothetical protein